MLLLSFFLLLIQIRSTPHIDCRLQRQDVDHAHLARRAGCLPVNKPIHSGTFLC